MFIIRSIKQVMLATMLATLLSVLLSAMMGGASIFLFNIHPEAWTLTIGMSVGIPLLVAGLVTWVIFHQMMQLQLAKEQIEEMSRTDFLTKIYNREYFLDAGKREFATAYRYKQSLTVMMIDIDHFKKINDTHGHLIGDGVLQEVVTRINALIRQSDLFARFGGDEFVLLSPHANLKTSEKFAKRIKQEITSTTVHADGVELQVAVSIGLAGLVPEHRNIDKLIESADAALYRAKEAGRNTIST